VVQGAAAGGLAASHALAGVGWRRGVRAPAAVELLAAAAAAAAAARHSGRRQAGAPGTQLTRLQEHNPYQDRVHTTAAEPPSSSTSHARNPFNLDFFLFGSVV
jgi:hypothetical protein